MQALKVAVVAMGVLIVAGVAVLGAVLASRISGRAGPIASVVLQQPAGTRITGASLAADRLGVTLQGGGPDRIVVVDVRTGRVLGQVGLAR